MAEDRNLKERLVRGFERDGKRRCFDEQAKRELVNRLLHHLLAKIEELILLTPINAPR